MNCDYCGSKVKKSEVKMTDMGDQVCIPCLIGRPIQAKSELSIHAKRGILSWISSDGQAQSMNGSFYLIGSKVIARKFRGRNYFHLTDINSVHEFQEVK